MCEVGLRSYGPSKVFPIQTNGSWCEVKFVSVRWPNAVCRKHLGARFRPFGVYLYPLWSVVFVKSACLMARRLELRGGCGCVKSEYLFLCSSFGVGLDAYPPVCGHGGSNGDMAVFF